MESNLGGGACTRTRTRQRQPGDAVGGAQTGGLSAGRGSQRPALRSGIARDRTAPGGRERPDRGGGVDRAGGHGESRAASSSSSGRSSRCGTARRAPAPMRLWSVWGRPVTSIESSAMARPRAGLMRQMDVWLRWSASVSPASASWSAASATDGKESSVGNRGNVCFLLTSTYHGCPTK